MRIKYIQLICNNSLIKLKYYRLGKTTPNATQEEAMLVLRNYLKSMEKDSVNDPSEFTKEEQKELAKIKKSEQCKKLSKQNKKFIATPSKI